MDITNFDDLQKMEILNWLRNLEQVTVKLLPNQTDLYVPQATFFDNDIINKKIGSFERYFLDKRIAEKKKLKQLKKLKNDKC